MEAEEWISEVEDRVVEITATEKNKEKRMKKTEESLSNIWDNIKHINIHIIEVPEGEKREKGPDKIFAYIIIEHFPNMGKEALTQVEETQSVQYKIKPRRNKARQILIKLTKIKFNEKILRAPREKQQIIYKGIPIRIPADLSRNCTSQKGVAKYIWGDEEKEPRTMSTLPSKAVIHTWRRMERTKVSQISKS